MRSHIRAVPWGWTIASAPFAQRQYCPVAARSNPETSSPEYQSQLRSFSALSTTLDGFCAGASNHEVSALATAMPGLGTIRIRTIS